MQAIISLNLDAATIARLRELGYVDPETRNPLDAALSEASGVARPRLTASKHGLDLRLVDFGIPLSLLTAAAWCYVLGGV